MGVVYQKKAWLTVEDDGMNIGEKIAPNPYTNGFSAELRRFLFRRVLSHRAWRCRRAHAYLLKHDSNYRFEQDGKRLVRARERARARGIGPTDPEYPVREMFREIY